MGIVFNIFHRMEKAWNEMLMRPRGVVLLLSLLGCFGVLLLVIALNSLKTLACIVIFAGVLFPIFLDKWKAGFSFLLVFLGTILLLQEQKWFQGFFQNTTVVLLQKQGKEYGEKLKDFQDTMAKATADNYLNHLAISEALNTVSQQQAKIDVQQQMLNETEMRVTETLARAEAVQGRAEERQQYLETNMTAFVASRQSEAKIDNSLFGVLTDWQTESYQFSQTNSVLALNYGEDDSVILCVRLEKEAIVKTIDFNIPNAFFLNSPGFSMLRPNIITFKITRQSFDDNFKRYGVRVRYLPYPSSSSIFSWSIISSNVFTINGLAFTPVKRFILP